MTKLTDTQLVTLSAASRRRDFSVYPLPRSIKRGDGPKVLKQLLSKGLIEETEAIGLAPVWRVYEDGYNVTLVLADAGFYALGLEREDSEPKPKAASKKSAKQSRPNTTSKQDKLLVLLRSRSGANIIELSEALDWLPHTTRAAITVLVKRKLGLTVVSAKTVNRGRVYRVAP
jgi:hypothetical protein